MWKSAAQTKLAAEKAENAETVDPDVDFAELCLPCEDKAYEDRLGFRFCPSDHRLVCVR